MRGHTSQGGTHSRWNSTTFDELLRAIQEKGHVQSHPREGYTYTGD